MHASTEKIERELAEQARCLFKHRPHDSRPMDHIHRVISNVVEDLSIGNDHPMSGPEWFRLAEIAITKAYGRRQEKDDMSDSEKNEPTTAATGEAKARRVVLNPAMAAVADIEAILAKLSERDRVRVLGWITDTFDDDLSP